MEAINDEILEIKSKLDRQIKDLNTLKDLISLDTHAFVTGSDRYGRPINTGMIQRRLAEMNEDYDDINADIVNKLENIKRLQGVGGRTRRRRRRKGGKSRRHR